MFVHHSFLFQEKLLRLFHALQIKGLDEYLIIRFQNPRNTIF